MLKESFILNVGQDEIYTIREDHDSRSLFSLLSQTESLQSITVKYLKSRGWDVLMSHYTVGLMCHVILTPVSLNKHEDEESVNRVIGGLDELITSNKMGGKWDRIKPGETKNHILDLYKTFGIEHVTLGDVGFYQKCAEEMISVPLSLFNTLTNIASEAGFPIAAEGFELMKKHEKEHG
jgi:hypothetical protein